MRNFNIIVLIILVFTLSNVYAAPTVEGLLRVGATQKTFMTGVFLGSRLKNLKQLQLKQRESSRDKSI